MENRSVHGCVRIILVSLGMDLYIVHLKQSHCIERSCLADLLYTAVSTKVALQKLKSVNLIIHDNVDWRCGKFDILWLLG